METIPSDSERVNARGPLQATVRRALNDAALQISTLQRRVSAQLGMKETDLDCYNLVHNEGPVAPSELARRMGVHPATMTGMLDRLERGGWVVRERETSDRRAVQVRALRERNRELFDLLAGMNTAMDEVLHDFSTGELKTIAAFLTGTVTAGRSASDDLIVRH